MSLASPVTILLVGLGISSAAMAVLWLIQRRTGDAGIVDPGWAFSLGLFAVLLASFGSAEPGRRWLLVLLCGAWSLRLGLFLLFDRVLKGPEDGRYVMLRQAWGERQQPYLFVFFQAQAIIAALFAVPLAIVAFNPRPLGALDAAAVALWALSVGGESLADAQLARFKKRPGSRGRTCREGLWAWSRHPNYFFEWLHWFVPVLLAWGSPWWPASLLGPALMLFLLFRVTGIPYTEKRALQSRGEEYARYQREVPAFVPWFPRRESSSDQGQP